MKTHIKSNFPLSYAEKDMTRKELADLRKELVGSIRTWFKWEHYQPSYNHLVYYVEFNGEAYVYQQGWIMDEREFEELIANRQGVTFAGVMHRR